MKDKVKIYYINEQGLGILKGSLENLTVNGVETDNKDTIATHVLYSYGCQWRNKGVDRAITGGDYIEFADRVVWVCHSKHHPAEDGRPAHDSITWE